MIVVDGEPVAQGRPRFSTRGGVFRAYDPPDSRDYKDYIKMLAKRQWGRKTTNGRKFELVGESIPKCSDIMEREAQADGIFGVDSSRYQARYG
jgi:hypothetical protein